MENQQLKALPKMIKAASDSSLKSAFETHLEETKVQVERLEEIAKILGASPKNKICKAMQGLIQEGDDTIKEEAEASIKDLALVTAAQKVEHYEISGYSSAFAEEIVGNAPQASAV